MWDELLPWMFGQECDGDEIDELFCEPHDLKNRKKTQWEATQKQASAGEHLGFDQSETVASLCNSNSTSSGNIVTDSVLASQLQVLTTLPLVTPAKKAQPIMAVATMTRRSNGS